MGGELRLLTVWIVGWALGCGMVAVLRLWVKGELWELSQESLVSLGC